MTSTADTAQKLSTPQRQVLRKRISDADRALHDIRALSELAALVDHVEVRQLLVELDTDVEAMQWRLDELAAAAKRAR